MFREETEEMMDFVFVLICLSVGYSLLFSWVCMSLKVFVGCLSLSMREFIMIVHIGTVFQVLVCYNQRSYSLCRLLSGKKVFFFIKDFRCLDGGVDWKRVGTGRK